MENSDYINDADEIGLYVMSVAAKLVGTHPQTLREYERRGLITPQRTDGGNRRYANNDIEKIDANQNFTRRRYEPNCHYTITRIRKGTL